MIIYGEYMKKETTNTNSIQDSTIISTENDVKKNNDVENVIDSVNYEQSEFEHTDKTIQDLENKINEMKSKKIEMTKENLVYVEPWKLIKNQIMNKQPKTELEQKIDSLVQKRIRFLKHKSH